jgi:sugar O-acyltransferase (sialic acid O-acetyltransferase NeuD family)
MMAKAIVIGGGDLAKKIVRLAQLEDAIEIVGYTDLEDQGPLFGVEYLGQDEDVFSTSSAFSGYKIICGLAGIPHRGNNTRARLIEKLSYRKDDCPTLISSKTMIDDSVKIGNGTLIFPGSLIDYGVLIGNFSLINLSSTICHDNIIGDNVIISPNVTIAGSCQIGSNVIIGVSTTINPAITIVEDVVIGSGSVVTKDVLEPGTYMGNPVRKYDD